MTRARETRFLLVGFVKRLESFQKLMSDMSRSKSLSVGTLIKFLECSDGAVATGWMDEFGNVIPEFSLGMIVAKKYKRLSDYVGWEYDILIPTLGLVSPNWGDFAFEVLE